MKEYELNEKIIICINLGQAMFSLAEILNFGKSYGRFDEMQQVLKALHQLYEIGARELDSYITENGEQLFSNEKLRPVLNEYSLVKERVIELDEFLEIVDLPIPEFLTESNLDSNDDLTRDG